MIYNHADDVPDDVKHDLVTGIRAAGHKLREWRSLGHFHELRAQILGADGPITLICHHDDRISLIDGGPAVDITAIIDQSAG